MGTAFYKVATLYVDVLFTYLGNTPTKGKIKHDKAVFTPIGLEGTRQNSILAPWES
jgi:hypothetical protein